MTIDGRLFVLSLVALLPACSSRILTRELPADHLQAFVVAHADDWQLFMGDVAVDAVRSGSHVVFVYLTAGDAGKPMEYWRARERSALASLAFALGYAPPDSVGQTAQGGVAARCIDTPIQGHSVHRCILGSATSMFLRLPDGNRAGEGFPITGERSLSRLAIGGRSLSPLEGSGTFNTWQDLEQVVSMLLTQTAAAVNAPQSRIQVHASDPDTAFNPRDHADHRATGLLAANVARSNGFELKQYAGYSTARWPTNLSAERFAIKAALFMAYDRARVLADTSWSAYAEVPRSYSAWLSRTYARPPGFTGRNP